MAKDNEVNNTKTDILDNVLSITDKIVNYTIQNPFDLIVIGTQGNTSKDFVRWYCK